LTVQSGREIKDSLRVPLVRSRTPNDSDRCGWKVYDFGVKSPRFFIIRIHSKLAS